MRGNRGHNQPAARRCPPSSPTPSNRLSELRSTLPMLAPLPQCSWQPMNHTPARSRFRRTNTSTAFSLALLALAASPAIAQPSSEPPSVVVSSSPASEQRTDAAEARSQPGTSTSAQSSPPAITSTPARQPEPAPGAAEIEFRTGERDRLQFSLRGGVSYDFAADVDDTDGDISALRTQFGLGISYALSQQWLLNLDTDAELSFYEFSGFVGVVGPSDQPVDDVGELTLRGSATYIHSEHWAFFGGGIVQFAGEFDVNAGDAATYGGFGGARWQARPGLAVSFGLIGKSRLEDDPLVFPLLAVDWQINDTWALGSTGLEATLSAKLSQRWSWLLVGGWRPREFRLDDDNDVSGGVFRDDRVFVGTGVEFRPNPISSIRLIGGATVWSRYTIEDDGGEEVFEETASPTGFIGIRGTLRF